MFPARAMLLALLAFAGGLPSRTGPSPELVALRKALVEEIGKHKAEMRKLGYAGEIDDCSSIAGKVLDPSKPMADKGLSTPYPGDEDHEALLKAWAEFGALLAAKAREALPGMPDPDKAEVELFAGWFASFPDVARGIGHLNRRRKFCKLTPVMADWSGSYGGYRHGLYLRLNKDHPSTDGLGAHEEDPKLPGYSVEGAAAGHASLGGGPPEYVMDGWLGSAYHRDPVFLVGVTRINFGGLPGGWWSSKKAAGPSGKALADIVSFPGPDDTDIQPVFSGEGPNPLAPFGMTSSGTYVVVDYLKGKPKKAKPRLLGPDGLAIEIIEISKTPIQFVAKAPLLENTAYTVEITGADTKPYCFGFTTGRSGFGGR